MTTPKAQLLSFLFLPYGTPVCFGLAVDSTKNTRSPSILCCRIGCAMGTCSRKCRQNFFFRTGWGHTFFLPGIQIRRQVPAGSLWSWSKASCWRWRKERQKMLPALMTSWGKAPALDSLSWAFGKRRRRGKEGGESGRDGGKGGGGRHNSQSDHTSDTKLNEGIRKPKFQCQSHRKNTFAETLRIPNIGILWST